jgi:hypothetical protein
VKAVQLDLALQALTTMNASRSRTFRLPVAHAQSFRVAMLLFAVMMLNAVDLMYTLFAYGIQQMTELNPLADTFFAVGRMNSLICYKLLMVGCGCGMLWRLRRSRWAVPGCWVLLTAYTILAFVWLAWVKNITYSYETLLVTMTPMRNCMQP